MDKSLTVGQLLDEAPLLEGIEISVNEEERVREQLAAAIDAITKNKKCGRIYTGQEKLIDILNKRV